MILFIFFLAGLFGFIYLPLKIAERYNKPQQLEFAFIREERMKYHKLLTLRDAAGAITCLVFAVFIMNGMQELANHEVTTKQLPSFQYDGYAVTVIMND